MGSDDYKKGYRRGRDNKTEESFWDLYKGAIKAAILLPKDKEAERDRERGYREGQRDKAREEYNKKRKRNR